jgi:pilus assembly protein CpaD
VEFVIVSYRLVKSLFVAIAGSLALSACATVPASTDLPRASAVAETFRADMPVNPADNGLTWAQLDLLAAVADEYNVRGHGPLVITFPQGSNNEEAAIGAIAEARTYLYGRGLNWRQISGGFYNAQGQHNAAVIFSFTRYQAVAPDCPDGWSDLAREFNNRPGPRFGCAMATNLAAMISDPRDLISPRDQQPADTGRRQTIVNEYRAGESTASERSDYESGTVSSVGN